MFTPRSVSLQRLRASSAVDNTPMRSMLRPQPWPKRSTAPSGNLSLIPTRSRLMAKNDHASVQTSNAGHALFTGIARPERAEAVARVLMNRRFFTGWGIPHRLRC